MTHLRKLSNSRVVPKKTLLRSQNRKRRIRSFKVNRWIQLTPWKPKFKIAVPLWLPQCLLNIQMVPPALTSHSHKVLSEAREKPNLQFLKNYYRLLKLRNHKLVHWKHYTEYSQSSSFSKQFGLDQSVLTMEPQAGRLTKSLRQSLFLSLFRSISSWFFWMLPTWT